MVASNGTDYLSGARKDPEAAVTLNRLWWRGGRERESRDTPTSSATSRRVHSSYHTLTSATENFFASVEILSSKEDTTMYTFLTSTGWTWFPLSCRIHSVGRASVSSVCHRILYISSNKQGSNLTLKQRVQAYSNSIGHSLREKWTNLSSLGHTTIIAIAISLVKIYMLFSEDIW